jgi:hypothetical protein
LSLCFPVSPRLIRLQVSVGEAQQWTGLPDTIASCQEVSDHMIRFNAKAGLDIAKHRSREGRTGRVQYRPEPLERRRARREAALDRDRHTLIEELHGQVGIGSNNVAGRAAHQAGDAGGSGNEYPLLPHFTDDRFDRQCIEFCSRESTGYRCDAVRCPTVLLAE